MKYQSPTINIFEQAVRKAGRNLIRDFGELENLQIQKKNLKEFLSNSNLKSEKKLLEILSSYYPKHSFYVNEKKIIENDKTEKIIINPLDGNINFAHSIPIFSIGIAKITNNEITDGVIFNPISNEFYWTSKGAGSWCNNIRLRVSKREYFSECMIGTEISEKKNKDKKYLDKNDIILKESAGIRLLGSISLSLAYVASGKLDAFWQEDISYSKFIIGVLLLIEAGGKASEISGTQINENSKNILGSNMQIHSELENRLR